MSAKARTGFTGRTKTLIARRDDYRCLRCGRNLLETPIRHSFHHRRLRSHPFPGLDKPFNGILLCGSGTTGCHEWVHNHQSEARRLGYIVSAYEDHPEQIPVYCIRRGWMLLDEQGGWQATDPHEEA